MIIGPQLPVDPLITVVLSLLCEVLNFIPANPSPCFFNSLSMLIMDHNTIIPSYFNDPQIFVYLAFLLFPKIGGQSLEKIAMDYLDKEYEDVDVEILDAPPPVFQTPSKA